MLSIEYFSTIFQVKKGNLLLIDHPVGAGFSYATNDSLYVQSDREMGKSIPVFCNSLVSKQLGIWEFSSFHFKIRGFPFPTFFEFNFPKALMKLMIDKMIINSHVSLHYLCIVKLQLCYCNLCETVWLQ